MTLPPSQIVSMIVFTRTRTEILISAVGIPVGAEMVVDRSAGLTLPVAGEVIDAGVLGAVDGAVDEEGGGVGLLKK